MTFTVVDSAALPPSPEVQVNSVATSDGTLYVTALLDAGGKPVALSTNMVSAASSAITASSITGNAASLPIRGQNAAQGGSINETGGTSSTASNAGGALTRTGGTPGAGGAGGAITDTGGAGNGTGAGGAITRVGGASGAGATGNGGVISDTGGAALSSNGRGGNLTRTGGVSTGTGAGSSIIDTPGGVSTGPAGGVFTRGLHVVKQGAPAALTTSATLTAANLLSKILTANQGGAASAAYQLPLATDLEAALPIDFGDDDGFKFSMINISTVAAETVSITTNTGWTLVGDMDIQANSAATTKSAARFMARRTASGAYVLYRLS